VSRGLLAVAEMLGMVGKAAQLATADIRETVKAAEAATATSSTVARAAGGTASTMGSSQADGVTTNGLAAALQITRGRSR
jgi:hypothetical protein